MYRTSCIRHLKSDIIAILRNDYLQICENNKQAALLLSIFEYWTNLKIGQIEQQEAINNARIKEGLKPKKIDMWFYRSIEKLIEDTLGLLKEYEVRSGLKYLLENRLIHRRRNPEFKWDKTYQYLLNLKNIQERIDEYQDSMLNILSMDNENINNGYSEYKEAIQENKKENKKEIIKEDSNKNEKKFSKQSRKATAYYCNKYSKISPEMYKAVLKKNPNKIINEWRDTFDKLLHIDNQSANDIKKVIDELFTGQFYDFWIAKGNFRTAKKFRDKMRDGTLTYFDHFRLKLDDKYQRNRFTNDYGIHLPGVKVIS